MADSNRFGGGGDKQWLSVVDAGAALQGGPALLGQVAAGAFPRELTVSADGGTVYVSNYASGDVESVDVSGIAGA
jgi:DNA-binding beta-propeller fold protein YncE